MDYTAPPITEAWWFNPEPPLKRRLLHAMRGLPLDQGCWCPYRCYLINSCKRCVFNFLDGRRGHVAKRIPSVVRALADTPFRGQIPVELLTILPKERKQTGHT